MAYIKDFVRELQMIEISVRKVTQFILNLKYGRTTLLHFLKNTIKMLELKLDIIALPTTEKNRLKATYEINTWRSSKGSRLKNRLEADVTKWKLLKQVWDVKRGTDFFT